MTIPVVQGCYRRIKVPFGLGNVPEAYREAILDSILCGTPGVIKYLDLVVVYPETKAEFDQWPSLPYAFLDLRDQVMLSQQTE